MTNAIITASRSGFNHIVAFEVAKAELVVNILPDDRVLRLANRAGDVRRLLKAELKRSAKLGLGSALIVCEATGGYEQIVLDAADALGIACHRAHGSAVRAYARFTGTHAKSDPIDVRLIARYARDKEDLRLYRKPRAAKAAARALVGRREDLIAMVGAERCRLEHANLKAVRRSIEATIRAIEKQLATIEDELARLIAEDQEMKRQNDLMQSFTGVGPVTAASVLAYLPEIGTVSRGTIAALAGVAPLDNDSGAKKGARHIFAGRCEVRKCLYMAAVTAMRTNPVIREFAQRLTRAGHPFKLVATAAMRKIITILNTMLARDEPWKHAKTT